MTRALALSGSGQISGKKLGEILVDMKLLSEDQVKEAVDRGLAKRMRLGDLLINEGLITPADLAKALAVQYELQYLDLDTITLSKDSATILPEKLARSFFLLPIEQNNSQVTIATFDPIQLVRLDNLKKLISLPIILKVCTKAQIEASLDKIYTAENSVEKIVKHLAKKPGNRKSAETILSSELKSGGLESKYTAPSIESLVNKFIEKAIQDRASDIHMDPAEDTVRVRIRIDGVLHELHQYPPELHSSVVTRMKVLAQLDISEKRNPQDGRFQHLNKEKIIDVRVSTLPTVRGEKIVLRLLDKDKMKGTLAQIGMSSEVEESIKFLLQRPYGMIFITGPTGSGKTTTLYSMLNQLNGIEKNIITVEDPVEYKFDTINQVQVNEKAGLNFAGLLKNILRQDPDVLMIGEVRDQETADISIRAALTGHLVLSTLHTNDAVSTPNRLIDMGVEPFLISSALVAVLAQRLVRVLCVHCREKVQITEEDIRLLGTNVLPVGTTIYGPVGCEQCHHSGYLNRVAIFELMILDDQIRKMILERESEVDITKHLAENGFISMRQDGIYKIAAGITSVEEVLRATL
jgi:type IV pilus assembly protein PilB